MTMTQFGSIANGSMLSGDSVVTKVTGQKDLLYETMLISALPDRTTMACPSVGILYAGEGTLAHPNFTNSINVQTIT